MTDEKTKQKVERLVNYTPYKIFQAQDQPTIFLRAGKFYFESGEEVTEVPTSVLTACRGMTEEGKKTYGFVEPTSTEGRGPGRPRVAA